MNQSIQINQGSSYKIGIDEVVGLKAEMLSLLKPVRDIIKDQIYWSEVNLDESEYKRRDGFIPHSHNCGGIQICEIIPKCEEYSFGYLEFGECDECGNAETYPDGDHMCGYGGQECASESENHLDAKLRIWLKFEGIEDGSLKFYLYLGGGNGDAPYFRTHSESEIFEASFECKSVSGLKRAAAKHIKALIKIISK